MSLYATRNTYQFLRAISKRKLPGVPKWNCQSRVASLDFALCRADHSVTLGGFPTRDTCCIDSHRETWKQAQQNGAQHMIRRIASVTILMLLTFAASFSQNA